ncbi:MAG: aldehyde dehydrogenase family protein [Actinomycetota bacterium]
MSNAVAASKRLTLGEPLPLLIGGSEIAADEHLDAVEPSTGRTWARIPAAGQTHVDDAVAAATAAFPRWAASTLSERQTALGAAADRLMADAERWPALLATENGRAIREAGLIDVPTAAEIFRYFAGAVRSMEGRVIEGAPASSLVLTRRKPLGVVAALVPWNSPIISIAHKLAPALAAGNSVVLKPSELASVSCIELVRLIADLFPPGTLNVVTGDGAQVGGPLVSHPGVAKVSFTGGTDTGKRILTACAENLTPALMELGGKGSLIVCDDAPVDTVVEDALTGIFAANGEVCFASSRLLVHESRYDEIVERMVARADAVVVGDALDMSTQLGPLISTAHREGVIAAIDRAVAQGAEVAAGGTAIELQGELAGGSYFRPTVVLSPVGDTSASCDEFFGPVLTIETWSDPDEAVARANDVAYGLANGIWSKDIARAHTMADRLDSGMVWVNQWFATPLGQPQGGNKASGFGREGSLTTLDEYSATTVVNVSLDETRPPMWT